MCGFLVVRLLDCVGAGVNSFLAEVGSMFFLSCFG